MRNLLIISLLLLGAGTASAQRVSPVHPDTIPTGCQLLDNECYAYINNNEAQKCYDTSKKFIETCPLWHQSWRAFGYLGDAAPQLGFDSISWVQFRQWLESVLYRNTVDPEYFCQCVETIAGTFYSKDTSAQLASKATNTVLAVYQWLILHTVCDTPALGNSYTKARFAQHYNWQQDTNAYPLDTTLPSMRDLGLDSILNIHLQMQGVAKPPYFANILQSVSLSDNPFRTNSTLRFDLSQMTYLRTEVYDELGRMVVGDGSGKVFSSGGHEILLDLSGLASGAYYLRISLADGEVRTVKMVKQN